MDQSVILFNNYLGQKEPNKEFWNGFVDVFNSMLSEMDREGNFQTHYEGDDDGYNGVLTSGNSSYIWKHLDYTYININADKEPYRTLDYLREYNDSEQIIVWDWITFITLDWDILDYCFKEFKGKIFCDDTFESFPIRNNVMEVYLDKLGYDINKIGFFTNCPRMDGEIVTGIHYRNDWLHLSKILTANDPDLKDDPCTIPYLDVEQLKDYDRKKTLFLALNGHTTFQRCRMLGSLFVYDVIGNEDKLIYSMCDVGSYHPEFFYEQLKWHGLDNKQFAQKQFKKIAPKRLPNDIESGRERDMFVQTEWWADTFFNLNVDTNQNYMADWQTNDHNALVNISEKWLKQIMYYTPGININDYTHLEHHHKQLGFKDYGDFIDQSYDIQTDRNVTADMVARVISNMQKPDRSEWKAMMLIADYNFKHLHDVHIPRLKQSFIDCVEKLMNQ